VTAQGTGRTGELLTMGPLAAIVQLGVPMTLVMTVAAASNVALTYYVSRLGTDAIGAVSLVFPVSLLATTAMAGGLGAGASSAVARALGAGRTGEARAIAGHAIVMAIAVGVVFALATWVGVGPLFRLMGARGAVLDGATRFAHVLFGGAAITFTAGMLDSVLRGEGNVRVPAIWSSSSLLGQIAITPLLMFGAGLGLVGAPVAMLGCQLAALLPRLRWVFGGRAAITPTLDPHRGLRPTLATLQVGVPAALATSMANLGIMVLTGVFTRISPDALAAYGLATRLDFVLLSLAYGVGSAVLTLVAMASGARQLDRVHAVVVRGGAMIVALLAVPAALLVWRPSLWLGLFTDDPGVHAVGAGYFRIAGPTYPLVGINMLVSFAFQGLGRAGIPTAFMAVRISIMLAAAIFVTSRLGLGSNAVFGVIAASNVVSVVAMLLLYRWLHARLRRAAPSGGG
jgi:putative MATE family efflux protein